MAFENKVKNHLKYFNEISKFILNCSIIYQSVCFLFFPRRGCNLLFSRNFFFWKINPADCVLYKMKLLNNVSAMIMIMIIHLPFFVVFPMLDPEVPPSPILLLVPCSHSHLRELQIDWDWPPSSFFEKCTVRGVFFVKLNL